MAANPKILLVEDDPAMAGVMSDLLKDADYEVDGPYASLADGVAAVAADFPAGAVLDVRIGDGNVGLLADDLEQYDIPYLFCTGATAHPAIDAHPNAPLVPEWALSRQLIRALRRIVH